MNGPLSLKPGYMNGSLIHKPSERQAGLVLEGSSDPAEHYAYHTLLSNRPTNSEGYSFWRHPCVRPFRPSVHPSGTISQYLLIRIDTILV